MEHRCFFFLHHFARPLVEYGIHYSDLPILFHLQLAGVTIDELSEFVDDESVVLLLGLIPHFVIIFASYGIKDILELHLQINFLPDIFLRILFGVDPPLH